MHGRYVGVPVFSKIAASDRCMYLLMFAKFVCLLSSVRNETSVGQHCRVL